MDNLQYVIVWIKTFYVNNHSEIPTSFLIEYDKK